jgi:VWFA-related protein
MVNAPAVVMVIAALVCAASAQQPVFRSRVELVTVDVTVVDGDGNPVRDLAADRFEVNVDGSPRRIVWAEFVPHHTMRAAAPASADHFTSNEGTNPGQLVLIAVDQSHIRRVEGLAALRAAATFIDALDPADRVAAVPVNHGGGIQFTTEHAIVKRYLQRLTGEASAMPVHFKIGLSEALAIADGSRTRLDQTVLRECGAPLGRFENLRRLAETDAMRDPCPVQVEQEGRALAQQARTEARLTLDSLHALVQRLGEIDGPKTLVLLSEGLVAEAQLIDLTTLGAAARAARVTIYVLQLETPLLDASAETVSPTLFADMQLRADGLARLAGSARGGHFRLVGADPYPFRKIVRELSGHYLVAFEAADRDRDGKVHRISVNVRAKGVTVRARPAFQIPAGSTAPALDTELVRVLRNPRLSTELPVRIAAYAFRDAAPDKLHLLLAAETEAGGAGQEAAAGFVLIDSRGVIAASGAGLAEAGKYVQSATVTPGRYTLKAAAISKSGRQGSVERQLDVKLDGRGPVKISELMLAETNAGPSGALQPLVVRAAGELIVAYVEVYADDKWSADGAGGLVELTREEAPGEPHSIAAGFKKLAPGRFSVSADIPLKDLEPGTYAVKLTLRLPGQEPQYLTRRVVIGNSITPNS